MPHEVASVELVIMHLWENLAYGIRTLFVLCAFLVVVVAQVEICRSPGFVIYMSNNPSFNCCHRLRRPVDLYQGKISLHFGPPSQPSCHTRSSLLWALIRILYLHTSRFIELLYVRSPLASWVFKNNRLSSTTKFNSCLIFSFISNSSAQVHLIDFLVTCSMRKCHTCT